LQTHCPLFTAFAASTVKGEMKYIGQGGLLRTYRSKPPKPISFFTASMNHPRKSALTLMV
jgi:hypothetical protein